MWSQLDPVSLLAVLICDARTWSYKKQGEECENNFGNWTVLLCWMDPDLCIRDGWPIADPQCGVGLTHEVSSSVLICDAKTWSTKKKWEECENYSRNWTVSVLNRYWTVYQRWETNSPWFKSLPQSWSVMLRLGPLKKHEKSVKTIPETGLYPCWIGIELCTRNGTLIADPNLVHQIAKRESFFRNWAVLLWWMDLKQSTRDGWLIADPQYSLLAVLSHFLSRNWNGTFIQVSCYVSF